ncbi:MAG: YfcE family phosphodiesterase [Gammaproteobacteria bacterium]|nr:YfcE family phosphodiesterase [Gammaproteobacteria bacterium]MCW8923112.1 YfcE family phosphodiesterase [Gammaproteobacteria bacterium]
MSARIGLISDLHSTLAPLQEALAIFEREQVDSIICAGDIAGYGEKKILHDVAPLIDLLEEHKCLMISGNHDHWSDEYTSINKDRVIAFFNSLPTHLELEIEGKCIYVVHASPPDLEHGGIKLLDPEGRVYEDRKIHWANELKNLDADILITGHTHQILCEQLGDILLVNPGSTVFNHNCSILSLPDMQVEHFALSNKQPIKVWNWAMLFQD